MALEYKAELERVASRDGAHGLKRVCLLQNEASEETQQCETPLQWAVTTPRTYFMLEPSQKRAATVAARPMEDAAFLRRLRLFAGSAGTSEVEDGALAEGAAETAGPLAQAIAQAPLRLVSKSWARMFSAAAIHADAFGAARRLLQPVEAAEGLSRVFDQKLNYVRAEFEGEESVPHHTGGGPVTHIPFADCAWRSALGYVPDGMHDEEEQGPEFATQPIFAWERRPAHEELIARATTGLEFHEAACSWDSGFDTPGEYCNEIQNLRKDFADALVQREWFVDVEDVTCTKWVRGVEDFLDKLMPRWDEQVGCSEMTRRAEPARKVFRVVPLAYSVAELAHERARGSLYNETPYGDRRSCVEFHGGFVLTADGALPLLPSGDGHGNGRGMGPGATAKVLERAAERDRRAAEELRDEEGWNTALATAALAASSAAFTAQAAACRRTSVAPTIYALCAMRALVAAGRAEVPEQSILGRFCSVGLPPELFRRIALMIGVGDERDASQGSAVLRRMEISMEKVDAPWGDWDKRENYCTSDHGRDKWEKRRLIIPQVVLKLDLHGQELEIKGRLSGFEVPCSHETPYFGWGGRYYLTDDKKKLMRNRKNFATYKKKALPLQIDRDAMIPVTFTGG